MQSNPEVEQASYSTLIPQGYRPRSPSQTDQHVSRDISTEPRTRASSSIAEPRNRPASTVIGKGFSSGNNLPSQAEDSHRSGIFPRTRTTVAIGHVEWIYEYITQCIHCVQLLPVMIQVLRTATPSLRKFRSSCKRGVCLVDNFTHGEMGGMAHSPVGNFAQRRLRHACMVAKQTQSSASPSTNFSRRRDISATVESAQFCPQ